MYDVAGKENKINEKFWFQKSPFTWTTATTIVLEDKKRNRNKYEKKGKKQTIGISLIYKTIHSCLHIELWLLA